MKKILITALTMVVLLFSGSAFSQIQCAIDVTINEGSSIEMCKTALVPISASSGYVSYAWTGPQSGASQTIIPSVSGQYVVAAEDAIGCISTDTIQVIVHNAPIDAITSSAGDTLCPGATGSTLSLSGSYVLYDWGGGVSTPTHDITTGGTYSVTVADNNNCVATFSITLPSIEFNVDVEDGNACMGAVVLTASGGSTYSWSTGETGSTIVVAPNGTTDVDVVITEGSCMQTITNTVTTPENSVEYELQDTFYVAAGDLLHISGPAGFESYNWSPGNQLVDSTMQLIGFNGTQSQTIQMTAVHPDGCIWSEPVTIIVIDLVVPNGFSPNGDMMNDNFYVPELDSVAGKLVVWNRWGEVVYQSEQYQNDWSGTCEAPLCYGQGENLPEGTYFYQIDAYGITKEGYITLKR